MTNAASMPANMMMGSLMEAMALMSVLVVHIMLLHDAWRWPHMQMLHCTSPPSSCSLSVVKASAGSCCTNALDAGGFERWPASSPPSDMLSSNAISSSARRHLIAWEHDMLYSGATLTLYNLVKGA